MQRTKITDTDIDVSILGLGTVKLGRNTSVKYPSEFAIPNDTQALNILDTAWDCGINLLDTAPAYGNSEERLGELLPKCKHDWIISTKVGEIFNAHSGESTYNFSAEFIQKSIEDSLRKLRREVLDIVLIHSNGDDKNIILKEGALEILEDLKKKGIVRATGMSTKTVTGGKLAVDRADIVMVTHNLIYQEEVPVIEYAANQRKSIFIKKALASGHSVTPNKDTLDTVSESFDNIFINKGVSSVILGSINPKHIKENANKAFKSYKKATQA